MSLCPSDTELLRLLEGEPAATDPLSTHLSGCADCQGRLERLIDDQASLDVRALHGSVPATEVAGYLQHWKEHPPDVVAPTERAARLIPTAQIPGYEILDELGVGGMGAVYKARQRYPHRTVALKVVKPGRVSASALRRFEHELQLQALLQHPGIAQVYEAGTFDTPQGEQPFFSMEFIPGRPLTRYAQERKLGSRACLELFVKVCEAIQHAHQKGVIHRDLKPGNILVDESGQPKILDFGIARLIHLEVPPSAGDMDTSPPVLHTAAGALVGTLPYMSPEQVAPDPRTAVDTRSDIYALGLICYELLAGSRPYDLKDKPISEVIRIIREVEPPPLRQADRRLKGDLETIVSTALAKDRERRYQSAAHLAEDIRHYLAGEPIQARTTPFWERAWKWSRRRPATAAAIAFFFLLVLGSMAALWWDWDRTNRHNLELTVENVLRTAAEEQAKEKEQEATRQAGIAEQRRLEAEHESGENRRRFIRMTIASSQQRLAEGDLFGSLLYAAEALSRDDRDGPAADIHRLRLAAGLQQAPRLLQVWSLPQAVTHVTFSPDGSKVLATGMDGTARLWDTATGEPVTPEALTHDGPVNDAVFSPDGRRVATAGEDSTVRLWDAQSGQRLREFKVRYPALQVAFKPGDGKHVLAVSGNKYEGTFMRNGSPIPGPPTIITDRIMTGVGPGGIPQYTTMTRTIPGPTIPGTPQTVQPLGAVYLWDVDTGQPVGKPFRHQGWINFAAFSPDGARVVTAGGSLEGKRAAELWDVTPADEPLPTTRKRMPHASDVHGAVFSPDGERVLTGSGPVDGRTGEAQVWDGTTQQRIGRVMKHDGPVTQAWFSPNGRRVLTASADETARVWDADTGEAITPPLRHRDRLVGAWFSPDGRRVLTASWDGTARVWDAASGEPLSPLLRHASRLTAAAFSPEGRRILTASRDGEVRLWDLAAGAYRLPFLEHRAVVQPPDPSRALWSGARGTLRSKQYLGDVVATSAVFTPDGRFIVTGAGSRVIDMIPGGGQASAAAEIQTHHLCVWDAATGELLQQPLPHTSPVTAATLSPDGQRLVTVSSEGVRLWEVPSGKLLTQRPPEREALFRCVAFHPDGRCFLVTTIPAKVGPNQQAPAGGVVQVRDVLDNEWVVPPLEHEGQVERAALSADGSKLITLALKSVGADKKNPRFEWLARAWNLTEGGQPSGQPVKPNSLITQLAVSPNGEQIVTYRPSVSGATIVAGEGPNVGQEGEAHLWHLRSGAVFLLPHAGTVTYAAFSPDGQHVVTASADRTARVWDLQGRPVSPPLEHRAGINHAAFGGKGLVATASSDHMARVWDVTTGEAVLPPLKHTNAVLHVAFSADGRRLATSDLDGTTREWDLSADGRDDADLKRLAQLLACQRLDATGGPTPLDREALQATWKELRRTYPDGFAAPREQVFAWHREEAEEAERAGDWPGTRHHLDWLIAAAPDQGLLRARRARAHVRLAQWELAEDDYARAVDLGQTGESIRIPLALIQLKRGRVEASRRTCDALLEQPNPPDDPRRAASLLRVCVLAPDGVSDVGRLVKWAQATAANKNAVANIAPGTLGAALYRTGQYDEAMRQLNEAVKASGGAGSIWEQLFLAMACQRSGKGEEAREWLRKGVQQMEALQGRKRVDGTSLPVPWAEQVQFELLRREAETLLGP